MRYGVHFDTNDYCTVFEGRDTEEDTREYIKELIQQYINEGISEGYTLVDEETIIDDTGAYMTFAKSDNDFYYVYLSLVTDEGKGWMDMDGELI